jgi:hypothetical protein
METAMLAFLSPGPAEIVILGFLALMLYGIIKYIAGKTS